MKPSALLAVMIITALIICGTGCRPSTDPVARQAEALVIVKRLVKRDAQHSMHEDLRHSKDKDADATSRAEASARTNLNCEDLGKLRSLIDTGRPLADYSPIEKLGRFVGDDPHRFFLCGLLGFVTDQGPEPYSIKIDVDSSNVITKVGPLVASH